MAEVSVGSIVYMYDEGSKLKARPRYVVLAIDGEWCTLRRFADKQLGRITYSVKLSQCYLVPEEIYTDADLPPYPREEHSDEEPILSRRKNRSHIEPEPDLNDSSSDSDSSDEEGSDVVSDEDTPIIQ